MSHSSTASRRRRKVFALASAGLVIGVGAVATLAAWNDNEWISGTANGKAGIGTSAFEVQQNRAQGSEVATSTWDDHESSTDAGELTFAPGALALTPGDSVYAPVALRTTDASVAGTVTLQTPIKAANATTDDVLWNALTYSVRVTDTATDCSASTWGAFGESIAADQSLSATLGASSQSLNAKAGNVQYYCFKVTLPSTQGGTELQGKTVAPAWRFASTSATAAP